MKLCKSILTIGLAAVLTGPVYGQVSSSEETPAASGGLELDELADEIEFLRTTPPPDLLEETRPNKPRDPFVLETEERPELAAEGLKRFPASSLTLVGILSLDEGRIALFQGPDQELYAASAGDEMRDGVVLEIQERNVVLELRQFHQLTEQEMAPRLATFSLRRRNRAVSVGQNVPAKLQGILGRQ